MGHRPNARAKAIKILQESIGLNFPELGLGNGSLGVTSKYEIRHQVQDMYK